RLAGPLGPLAQVRVEHLLPGRGVDRRRTREHPVEIEQEGADVTRQAEGRRVGVGRFHAGVVGGTWRHGIKHTTPPTADAYDRGRPARVIRRSSDAPPAKLD